MPRSKHLDKKFYHRAIKEIFLSDGDSNMEFRLDKDEYFSSLAAMLDLLAVTLERYRQMKKPPLKHHIEMLRELQEELTFLQDRCRIVDK